MTLQAQTLDIRQLLNQHAAEVFATMLSMQIVPLSNSERPIFTDRVTGSVGLGGDTVAGAVYLHMSADFARQVSGTMLGMPPEDTAEAEVNDVVGEITNMLAGQLKSCLCDAGAPCAVSAPAIIRGTSYEIESPPDIRRELLLFKCDSSRIAVEVHIKFV